MVFSFRVKNKLKVVTTLVLRYELSRRFLVLIDRVNVVFAMLHSKLTIRY